MATHNVALRDSRLSVTVALVSVLCACRLRHFDGIPDQIGLFIFAAATDSD